MPALPLKEYQRESPDAIGRFRDAVRELEGAIRSLLACGGRPHLGEGRRQLIEAVRQFLDGLGRP
jgi:hypothetical protein